MSRYLLIRLKKISLMFLFPIVVELGILIYENVVKKEKANISMYNGLWYVATVAIIVFVTVYQIIKNYYLGHDSLWQIFPYSKEGLESLLTSSFTYWVLLFMAVLTNMPKLRHLIKSFI